jgi:DNA-binding transcriptional LysR family regulator
MLDGISLDQLRMFVTAASDGSFSAAARKLNRAQSAISHAVAALERALGVALFDRTQHLPRLTQSGQRLLGIARGIVESTEALKIQARYLSEGPESELSIVVDSMFPQDLMTEVMHAWQVRFPSTPLRIRFEASSIAADLVLDRQYGIGVVRTPQNTPSEVTTEPLFDILFVTVAAPAHPLASINGPVTSDVAAEYVQIVLSDRTPAVTIQEIDVASHHAWFAADPSMKLALLRAGLGWGNLPLAAVTEDLAERRLVAVQLETNATPRRMPMSVIYRSDTRPGIGSRGMIDELKALDGDAAPERLSREEDEPDDR